MYLLSAKITQEQRLQIFEKQIDLLEKRRTAFFDQWRKATTGGDANQIIKAAYALSSELHTRASLATMPEMEEIFPEYFADKPRLHQFLRATLKEDQKVLTEIGCRIKKLPPSVQSTAASDIRPDQLVALAESTRQRLTVLENV